MARLVATSCGRPVGRGVVQRMLQILTAYPYALKQVRPRSRFHYYYYYYNYYY